MIDLLKKYCLVIALVLFVFLQSCQQPGGNTTGSEFMPDMAHSVAYEANYYNYYYNNTWGSQDEYYEFAVPKLPVEGTVPRSSASTFKIPTAPQVQPYYYADTEDERTRATNELIDNPYHITDAGLETGKQLYNTFCAICHGEKGDGNGYLARDGGAYPVAPAILISDEFIAASNGRFYHSIMYGKNLMGAYKDKLSYEERWQVIHYIRSLQAKEKKLEYNQYANTLNQVDRPAGDIPQIADLEETETHDDGHHSDNHNHSDDHGDHSHDGEHSHDDSHGGSDHDEH